MGIIGLWIKKSTLHIGWVKVLSSNLWFLNIKRVDSINIPCTWKGLQLLGGAIKIWMIVIKFVVYETHIMLFSVSIAKYFFWVISNVCLKLFDHFDVIDCCYHYFCNQIKLSQCRWIFNLVWILCMNVESRALILDLANT
jgi:hypothetical protein